MSSFIHPEEYRQFFKTPPTAMRPVGNIDLDPPTEKCYCLRRSSGFLPLNKRVREQISESDKRSGGIVLKKESGKGGEEWRYGSNRCFLRSARLVYGVSEQEAKYKERAGFHICSAMPQPASGRPKVISRLPFSGPTWKISKELPADVEERAVVLISPRPVGLRDLHRGRNTWYQKSYAYCEAPRPSHYQIILLTELSQPLIRDHSTLTRQKSRELLHYQILADNRRENSANRFNHGADISLSVAFNRALSFNLRGLQSSVKAQICHLWTTQHALEVLSRLEHEVVYMSTPNMGPVMKIDEGSGDTECFLRKGRSPKLPEPFDQGCSSYFSSRIRYCTPGFSTVALISSPSASAATAFLESQSLHNVGWMT
ncbi:unnamed protein product, partial [Nesidiocoris tenuis]